MASNRIAATANTTLLRRLILNDITLSLVLFNVIMSVVVHGMEADDGQSRKTSRYNRWG